MMVVHLFSPDKSRDALFISNYANIQIKDVLTRVDGVGSITVFGSRDYAMQVWLDPNRLQSLNLTATDVTQALQAQNIQVASGVLNQPPVAKPGRVPGRGAARSGGSPTRTSSPISSSSRPRMRWCGCSDVARVELTAQDYSSNSYLDRNPVGRARGLPAARLERAARPATTSSRRWRSSRSASRPASSTRIVYNPTAVHPAVRQRRDRDDPRGGAARRRS